MVDDYHLRQYEQCYETTTGLMQLAEDCVGSIDSRRVLDVACGAGANVHHMLKRWSDCQVTGIDLDDAALAYAREHTSVAHVSRCRFEKGNMFELQQQYERGAFHIATLMHTLLLFDPDDYPKILRSMVSVTSEWIFLSALFTDKQMDVTSLIRDYVRFGKDSKESLLYSVFCMSRFRRVCAELGVKEVIFRDFEISIDLAGPAQGGVGTYTVKREDGVRLQFTGAVYLPWKFAALRLS